MLAAGPWPDEVAGWLGLILIVSSVVAGAWKIARAATRKNDLVDRIPVIETKVDDLTEKVDDIDKKINEDP